MERLWFSNTLLLGFDVAQNEKKYRISFSFDMFKNPNVKGMEVIIHFLLSQLFPKRMSEVFKIILAISNYFSSTHFILKAHSTYMFIYLIVAKIFVAN